MTAGDRQTEDSQPDIRVYGRSERWADGEAERERERGTERQRELELEHLILQGL